MDKNSTIPLSERMRPLTIDDFFGQERLIGKGTILRKAIENDTISSMVLWGPPGTGKTTLAHIIKESTGAEFATLSATHGGVKDFLSIVERAESGLRLGKKTILFIDEIHRWNKSQQDKLLPYVERGTIILIGATTENPSFELNSALLSRLNVFVLERLDKDSLVKIFKRALRAIDAKLTDDVVLIIAEQSNGDARFGLNVIDSLIKSGDKITTDKVKSILQKRHLPYDKTGDEHYNLVSALHKSMRGGDSRASVYWLVRMLEGGESPTYIARRLIRFASEDIGMANNSALLLANSVFDACHKLGMPECGVHLAHAVMYLAKSDKSISAYKAYERAQKEVKEHGALPVPKHLRNAPTKMMKDLGYGVGYKYTPLENSEEQRYIPDELRESED